MPPKRIVHERPYESVEELIEVEAWSVTRESLVLVGHPEIADGTALRVDLVLASGARLLRAEGRVLEQVPPDGDRPGGPRVGLKRVTRESQKFLNQIVESTNGPPPPPPRTQQFSLLDIEIELDAQQAEAAVAEIIQPPAEPESVEEVEPEPVEEVEPEPAAEPEPVREPADAEAKPRPDSVPAPPERDSLLERLRTRWSNISQRRGSE